jgi:hypothetical protein
MLTACQLDNATLERTSGSFFNVDGTEIPW